MIGNVHRVEDLVGRVRLRDDERLAVVDHATLQLLTKGLLKGIRFGGAGKQLAAALAGCLRHWKTPAAMSSSILSSDKPQRLLAMSR